MNTHKIYITLSIIGILVLGSCEKEVLLDFDHEPVLCLNCILNPDETIKANITISRSISDTGNFSPLNNASIELYENNNLFGELTHIKNGVYTLDKKPTTGKEYQITVNAEGFTPLLAKCIVPQAPGITYEKVNYINNQYDLSVELQNLPGMDYYWLYTTGSVNGRKNGGGNYPFNSPFIDNFNKEYDNSAKFGFTYYMQIRMTDEGYDGEIMKFSIPDIPVMDNIKRMADQHFLSADEHYDKYIKTTIINQMKEESYLPFYEPVQIYSNIKNGTGIFGSCAVTTVKL